MAALQLQEKRMEQPFFVVAPCPAPGKPYTPARSTEVSRIIPAGVFLEISGYEIKLRHALERQSAFADIPFVFGRVEEDFHGFDCMHNQRVRQEWKRELPG